MRRCGVVVILLGGVSGVTGASAADPQLFLGRSEGLRAVEAARVARAVADRTANPPMTGAMTIVTARSTPAFVPSRFNIPDGYAIDLERDVPRFAAPVDRDNLVSFEIVERGVGLFLDYESESYPIGDGNDLLLLTIERRF